MEWPGSVPLLDSADRRLDPPTHFDLIWSRDPLDRAIAGESLLYLRIVSVWQPCVEAVKNVSLCQLIDFLSCAALALLSKLPLDFACFRSHLL